MTRLAYLIPTLDDIGGAERQLLLLAKAFAACGWHVTVIVLSGTGGAAAEDLKADGAFFYSLHMRKAWLDPRGWRRYLAWHAVNQPDIVHAHLPHATFFARLVRLIAPVPVQIDTIHTIDTGTAARRILYRQTRNMPSHVTCVAQCVAHAYSTAQLTAPDRLSVIPNALEPPPQPALRNEPEENHRPFLWVAVGRLAIVKDYPTLLRAFAQLPGKPQLTIAGTGTEQTRLVELSQTLGIKDRVHFIGFVSNIWPLLAASDAFVLASLWEGLPVSILEACAAGLPVVATETRGAREALELANSGQLTPVGDPTALATAMADVMALHPSERAARGRIGRDAALLHCSRRVIADRWAQLYTWLLDLHPVATRLG